MIPYIQKIAKILFDDDPLVNRIVSLSLSAEKITEDFIKKETNLLFNKEPIENTQQDDTENKDNETELPKIDDIENPILKLMVQLKYSSAQFKERTEKALEWYKNKILEDVDTEISPLETYETVERAILRFPGNIVSFKYNPKYKHTLPYFDKYPLVLTISTDSEGFLGLNFHYLRPIERALFMAALYKYQGTKNEQLIIRIKYEQLKSSGVLRYYKPCIKRYLYRNMSPRMAIISPHLWDISLFLPTEKFITNKGSIRKQRVWSNSDLTIRKNK